MYQSALSRSVMTGLMFALVLLFTGSPVWASYPGQNGRIVLSANSGGSWQLYTINPDGTDMVQLTNLAPVPGCADGSCAWSPAFSPDGKWIVFTYGLFGDLYVINVDGTGLTRLTNDGLSSAARWSPDGTHIVFARSSPFGTNVITTMQADGTGEKEALTTDLWDSYGPTYTPDGRHIVNYSQNGGLDAAVWIMHANGSDKKRLTPAPLGGFPSDVSPDGEHILGGNHGGTELPTAIIVMTLDGTDLMQLTNPGNAHDLDAGYSPDGTKIVFASNRLSSDTSLDLFTMNADGSDIKRIATGLTVGGCPSQNCVTPSWGPKPTH